MSLVRVNNLKRYYGDHCAVDDISFTLQTGDILGFLGPNGAGKSTTMQMITGNLAPSEGEITIDGADLLEAPRSAKRSIGYLPETPPVYRDLTVDEYLHYCARLHGLNGSAAADAVDTAKRRCNLTPESSRLIGNLSKGYQQRVGIAQAIVHSPRVIILDEPTVGLDPIQIREIRELITELGESHGIILSTHILPEVQAVCNRVQIINSGRLVFESTMDEMLRDTSSQQYRVGFANSVSERQLFGLDCVEMVKTTGDDFIVTLNANADEFAQAAVMSQWGLNKLIPEQQNLEQIFVDLAHGDPDSLQGADT